MTTELLKQALSAMRDVADLMADRWPMDTQQRAPKFFQAMRDIDTALAQPADEDAWLEKAVDIAQEFDDRAFRADTEIQLRAHLRTRPAREGFVSVPVEPTEAMQKNDERYRWLRSRIPGSAYRVAGVIYSEGGAGVDSAIDAAMIEAAKGGGK